MLPEDQKRILGYFIEEAKDHLNTIEQGLLNLAATVDDTEMMNEVFRAAHSVKGGAAMLGINSIQRTAHRMEDFFKVMKESPVRADRDLETMLLQIFDGLQEQLEQLQSPYGLSNEHAQEIMGPLEPIFAQAEAHLTQLASAIPVATPVATPTPQAVIATEPHPETSALQLVFRSDVPALLRDMLATFKQPDTSVSRHQLGQICQRLHSLGEQFELSQWCTLTQIVNRAIANPDQIYRTLAPVVIKDLKQAQEQILTGAATQVTASQWLQDLLPTVPEPTQDSSDTSLDDLLAEALNDDATEPDLADLFATAEQDNEDGLLTLTNSTNWLDNLDLDTTDNVTDTGLGSVFDQLDPHPPSAAQAPIKTHGSIGPEVGAAELNSLADLFESNPEGLADIWEEADLPDMPLSDPEDVMGPDDFEAEFADLLTTASEDDSRSVDSDMASLFGYDLDAGPFPNPAPTPDPSPDPTSSITDPSITAQEEAVTVGAEGESQSNLSTPESFDFFGEPERSAPLPKVKVTAEALDDRRSKTPAPLLDDFFALDDGETEATGDASSTGIEDEVDHFFDSIAEKDVIDDDDTYALTEFNLDLAPEGSNGLVASLDNELLSDLSLEAPAALEPPPEAAIAPRDHGLNPPVAPTEAPPPQTDELKTDDLIVDDVDEDPFGELVLDDHSVGRDTTPTPDLDILDLDLDSLGLDILEATDTDVEVAGSAPATDDLTAVFGKTDLPWEETEGFNDLDSLLTESISEETDSAGFDDLEAMLASVTDGGDADRVDVEELTTEELTRVEPTSSFLDFGGAEADGDSFDDLEALLGETPSAPNTLTGASATGPAGNGVAQTELASESRLADTSIDEFDDLEKLLEEADQMGGSAPTLGSRRGPAVSSARRLPRRVASSTDQTMRVSVGHLDTLSNLVGELVVNRNSLEQDQERLRQFLDNLLHQVAQLNDVGQRMRDLYERSLLESSLIANRQAFALGVTTDRSSSHATGATFDALEMDRFTGFHTLSQEMIELIVRVREASSDIEFTIDSTDQIARQFRQVTTQLQEGLNKARMVPFGQTADRLPRAVRDISLKCGKEARLVVEGRDTLIDKMILERLYDPMTHLVNNAITHGIESPEERLATGKAREGTITVRAFYQGNQTVIYIADNGGGINPAVVKAKALKQRLITPAEAQTMTELEVYDLLFLPGFTTREQADDFSGRGVGMDVVRTALTDIRGSITIESEVGKGTSFTIRLPLTLSITKALSCVNNQARIAFPMDGVEDMFDVPKERIQTNEQGHSCILWRDTLLPFRPLGELLRFNRGLGRGRVYGGPQDEDVISMVVLRSASTYIALQVDQVIGEQEIVIKQLEGPVPKPTGIAGATVLGDGRVMPIADVLELIDLASGRIRRDPSTSLWTQPVEEPIEAQTQTEPTVLIVDDSITVRELLSMSFNKVGYRVEQARDGQEAWEKLRAGLPCDLVFCDIEMPRMDGLELLSRIQKDSTLNQLPIAMLTSRGADRHRQMAVDLGAKGYFTKPYLEEMLLDAAQRMLKGENMIPAKVVE
jgi:chemotaxis protein histidine kinase CheA/ActR/RegA family two-component response regulator